VKTGAIARSNLLFGGIGLVVAGVYLRSAYLLPKSMLDDTVGTAGFPKLIGFGLSAVSVLMVAFGVVQWWARRQPDAYSPSVAAEPERQNVARAAGVVAIAAIYIGVLPVLGYFISTSLLIAAASAYFGARNWTTLVLTSLGGSFAIWLVFGALLGMRLPTGYLADFFG
jgi:uncharacterized iron-regulated membrane protein